MWRVHCTIGNWVFICVGIRGQPIIIIFASGQYIITYYNIFVLSIRK